LPRGFFFLAGDDVVLSHLAYTLFSKIDGGVKGELVAHLDVEKNVETSFLSLYLYLRW
jgi:hypothetical protein